MTLARLRFLGVVLGLAASLVWIDALFAGKQTRFDQLAIGEGKVEFGAYQGRPVHCADMSDLDKCIRALAGQPPRDVVLWLGNSQLHAINQAQKDDVPASVVMHERLLGEGRYLFTASQPNANLQEHLVLLAHLMPILKPKVLLLPVVFDDLRETGVRDSLLGALDDPAALRLLTQSEIGRRLIADRLAALKHGSGGGDLGGLRETLQERSEAWLTARLEKNWSLWVVRPEARGKTMEWLYELRNWAFGIKPTTVRRMIPGRYADNWLALEAMVRLAQANDVRTFIYVPPMRDDEPRPYNAQEYAAFKERLFTEFGKTPGVVVADLEHVVPNQYWGNMGLDSRGQPIIDFMHFTAAGHRDLAAALFALLDGKRAAKP